MLDRDELERRLNDGTGKSDQRWAAYLVAIALAEIRDVIDGCRVSLADRDPGAATRIGDRLTAIDGHLGRLDEDMQYQNRKIEANASELRRANAERLADRDPEPPVEVTELKGRVAMLEQRTDLNLRVETVDALNKRFEAIGDRLTAIDGHLARIKDDMNAQQIHTRELLDRMDKIENDGDRVARPNAYRALRQVELSENRLSEITSRVAQAEDAIKVWLGTLEEMNKVVRTLAEQSPA